MAGIVRTYSYSMGFKVNGEKIPDPSVYTGKASALDSEGGRDANGKLHRCMVAMKHPVKLEYNGISWAMMESILSKMTAPGFNFTFPDPMHGVLTMHAYVGDRDWETLMAPGAQDEDGKWKQKWFGNLKFSVIEY